MDPIAPLIMPTAVGDRANAVDARRSATCVRLIALVAFAALLLAPSAGPVVGPHGSKTIVIGHSVRGQPIRAYERGDRSVPPTVVVGVIHGSEPAGLKVVARLRSMPLPAGVHLWLVPTVNPDGLAAGTRQNAHGVDLNRNSSQGRRFLGGPGTRFYAGPKAFSEPETRAIRALVLATRPAVTVWYHQPFGLVDRPESGGEQISLAYSRISGLRFQPLAPRPGSMSRWVNVRVRPGSSLVVELPPGRLSAAAALRHAEAVLALASSAA
jgi:murein peptide amidase A